MPRIAGERTDGVQAVILTLKILEQVAQEAKPIGVTTLAAMLGTNKSRIFRHLRTLVQAGYIIQEAETERYRVGRRLVSLGRIVGGGLELVTVAHGPLAALRDSLGHFAVVSEIDQNGVRILATVSGKSAIEIGVKQGSVLPFHSSAQGKVALAFGSEALRARVLRSRLDMATPKTIVGAAALRREIAKVRRQGWAAAPNESVIGLNALAAPIFDASGQLVATIGIVDSIQFIEAVPSDAQVDETVAAAREISQALGHELA